MSKPTIFVCDQSSRSIVLLNSQPSAFVDPGREARRGLRARPSADRPAIRETLQGAVVCGILEEVIDGPSDHGSFGSDRSPWPAATG